MPTMLSLSLFVSVALGQTPQAIQTPTTQPARPEEQEIRRAIDSYVAAYNKGDVEAVVRHFVDNAQYIDADGNIARGRDDIRQELSETLTASTDLKLAVEITSIDFRGRNMATVRGIGTVTRGTDGPTSFRFRTVHVRKGELWPMSSVEELSEWGEALDQLDWLVGNWLDEDEDASIRTECDWTPNRRFITRSFVASYREGPELRGTEIIGWDPAARVIRSWVFDSDGSFGQGIWSQRGDEWIVKSRGVLPDGTRASAVHIYHRVGEDQYTWESVNREAAGEVLPNIPPISIARAASTQPANASAEK